MNSATGKQVALDIDMPADSGDLQHTDAVRQKCTGVQMTAKMLKSVKVHPPEPEKEYWKKLILLHMFLTRAMEESEEEEKLQIELEQKKTENKSLQESLDKMKNKRMQMIRKICNIYNEVFKLSEVMPITVKFQGLQKEEELQYMNYKLMLQDAKLNQEIWTYKDMVRNMENIKRCNDQQKEIYRSYNEMKEETERVEIKRKKLMEHLEEDIRIVSEGNKLKTVMSKCVWTMDEVENLVCSPAEETKVLEMKIGMQSFTEQFQTLQDLVQQQPMEVKVTEVEWGVRSHVEDLPVEVLKEAEVKCVDPTFANPGHLMKTNRSLDRLYHRSRIKYMSEKEDRYSINNWKSCLALSLAVFINLMCLALFGMDIMQRANQVFDKGKRYKRDGDKLEMLPQLCSNRKWIKVKL